MVSIPVSLGDFFCLPGNGAESSFKNNFDAYSNKRILEGVRSCFENKAYAKCFWFFTYGFEHAVAHLKYIQ